MKKTTISLAIASALGTGVASAFPISSGTFTMYDPTGAVVGGSAVVTGDTTVAMTSPTPFFGFKWTAHDFVSIAGPGDENFAAPFDWGATANIPVVLNWIYLSPCNGPCVVLETMDGDADGIPGTAMTAGPFTGFSPYFSISSIPVPAAAWLFGSGLLGLIGVARRKRS